ncbi:MAG: nucleoside deaminase [Bacteroidia bacterium]
MMEEKFMKAAVEAALNGVREGKGGPFGAVIVKHGEIIASASNEVLASNDPTAHAEVNAIRQACKKLGSFQLTDCELYTTCEPCPMCLGAIYWARPSKVYFAASRYDAANAGFDDSFIYDEIAADAGIRKIPFVHSPFQPAVDLFRVWDTSPLKKQY